MSKKSPNGVNAHFLKLWIVFMDLHIHHNAFSGQCWTNEIFLKKLIDKEQGEDT